MSSVSVALWPAIVSYSLQMSVSVASSVASASDSEPEVELIDDVVPVANVEGHVEVHLLTDEELLATVPASELEPPQDRAAAEHENPTFPTAG